MSTQPEVVGLLPAGGQGQRMRPYRAWKELIAVGYRTCRTATGDDRLVPKVLVEYSLERMHRAGIGQAVIVLNEHKTELLRYLSDGHQYGMSLAYVCQPGEMPFYGMPIAINQAHEWLQGRTVVMGMPDTIVEPEDCYVRLLALHRAKKADLTLGVFPTNRPTSLAPVLLTKSGRVRAIYDKPKTTNIFNTWNVAVWSGNFTELLHQRVKQYMADPGNAEREMLLSDLFNLAIAEDLKVYGEYFKDGKCQDFGNIDEQVALKQQLELAR